MKAQNMVLVLVVVIMLASLGGTYLLFSQQGALSTQKIDSLKVVIDDLSVSLKKVDSGLKDIEARSSGYADSIKSLEEKISAGDADRKDIAAKVTDLMKAVGDIKGVAKSAAEVKQAAMEIQEPAPEPAAEPAPVTTQSETVDLGQIPVQK
ncbi:MAG TPA: hypothetical protein DCL35_02015 [Candidatus Omnitrophica bacterium]|nr:hypothetical protein [Candidatus Omnitrophota bacterium]